MTAVIKIHSPSERFSFYFKFMTSSAEFVGANVMKEDYRLTWLTWTVIAIIWSYFACTVYTIYVGVVLMNDWTVFLQSFCLAGPAIQGHVKLVNAIVNSRKLRALHAEIYKTYVDYEKEKVEYQEHLHRSLRLVKKIVFNLLLIYCITSISIVGVPLFYRMFLHQRVLIMQFYLPGINPETDMGYILHQVAHVTCICCGAFGNFASDFLCFILVAQIPLMKNILQSKFDDLDDVLRMNPRDSTKSLALLKDIFAWHQKYINFSAMAKNCFFWVIFVQIGTATNSIVCTIVCQFLGVMPSGPIYLIYSFTIMYSYCGLGNLVDISNDDVTTCIYNCLWYDLPVPEQKMLQIMLRESQRSEGMSIGGVSPLSLNTALQLTKTIYTVAMILNEFFN